MLSVTRMTTAGQNKFERIAEALDSNKQQLGRNYGALFETEVQATLEDSGYQNFFWDCNERKISSLLAKLGPKESNALSEFDAFVTGTHENFVYFREQFLVSSSKFPPLILNGSDHHVLIVEVKLNSKLLFDWILKPDKTGSRKLFFSDNIDSNLVKAVVINGGSDSENFVKSMDLEFPPAEFADYIKVLKKANINVFYKLWASSETFQDLFMENKEIKAENKEISAQLKELNIKFEKYVLKDVKEGD
jgi:hypothetical protein